jgi:two-component system NarL family sensor kinase
MDTQEARIYITIIITCLLLGTIIIYFTISVIRQQRRNLELQKANALAEISAMEKERARIATDLHDDLGPVLSVVKFRVDHATSSDEDEKEELVKASEQLDELIARMREVANNLMPSALHRKGLISAVEEFTRNVSDSSGLGITFTTGEELNVTEEKSINIYRVIQEVVHNCMKHAKASRLEIIFEEKNGFLKILCRDNGIGFDYSGTAGQGTGIGLRSIKNRTEIMGGNMTVESKPGKGTAFLFEIPIT